MEDVRKAELEKEAEFWVYSPTVTVDVKKSPVTFSVSGGTKVAVAGVAELSVAIERLFGFDGQVTLAVEFPPDSGLSAATVALGAGQRLARIPLMASHVAKPGIVKGKAKYRWQVGKTAVEDSVDVEVEVEPKVGVRKDEESGADNQ